MEQERISSDKVVVIPNGIRMPPQVPAAPQRRPTALPEDAPTVLFVGRLHPQKGIDGLSKHIDSLLNELPTHHLVIVGEGPLEPDIGRVIAASPNRQRIHMVGYQPDPLAWMQASELLVLPTRYEGMPNVVMEAMSIGRSVVTFDVEGVRELLGESELAEAQIVPSQNFPAFLARIRERAENGELRERCEAYNRERIARDFRLEDQLQRYAELYQSATGPVPCDNAGGS